MRESTARSIWTKGGAMVFGWLGIPSAVADEAMAKAIGRGFQVVTVHTDNAPLRGAAEPALG